MRVVYWGTYDTGKPRNRIMIRGLRENGVEVVECHANVWEGIDDKSQISHWSQRLRVLVIWLLNYPRLIWRYLWLPKHDAVIIGYIGHLDVLLIWLFARLRGVPVVWDAFLSLYNTIVEDRGLIVSWHPLSRFLFAWEWIACRAADIVVLDTRTHADYFVQKFDLSIHHTSVVFVGAETTVFPIRQKDNRMKVLIKPLTVLFYGQLIPLHGVETIIRAAQQTETKPIQWILIGRGQMESKVRDMLQAHPLPKLKWIPWIPYRDLVKWIHQADICLGILGNSEKAGRVIPNKVFQILATGTPLITRDSNAIREIINPETSGIFLIPAADTNALVDALNNFANQRHLLANQPLYPGIRQYIQPAAIGRQFIKVITGLRQGISSSLVTQRGAN